MKQIKKNQVLMGSLCALGCQTLFGLSYIFTKEATGTASALALLGWRFFLAAVVMIILSAAGVIKTNLKHRPFWPLLRIALFSPCIYFIGETVGIGHTTASESGVFLACIPVASLIASALILKKRASSKQLAGILITMLGVMLTVIAVGATSSFSLTGYFFLIIAVVSYALYSVFVEKADGYTEVEITYAMLVFGAIVFGILAVGDAALHGTMIELITLPFRERPFAVAIIYQGIGCSIGAFLLYNVAVAKIGVNRSASFVGVSTVVSIIAGALLLKEPFSIWQLMGTVVILLGVYAANNKIAERNHKE